MKKYQEIATQLFQVKSHPATEAMAVPFWGLASSALKSWQIVWYS